MKTTIKIATLVLIVMSIMVGCQKSNVNPAINPANSAAGVTNLSGTGGSSEKVIDPAQFVTGINNQYFPLAPGDTFYAQTVSVDGVDTTLEDIVISVSSDIKVILGVSCEVIHDVVTSNGILTEDTYDWYAQDKRGNVWYFGEDTKKLQPDGSWSTEGSFEGGVSGAKAGIIMPGNPQAHIGIPYHQELYVGHAEDKGNVLGTNETVTIGLGTFTNCVKTEETTVLDPGVIENKWYAPGLGQIKAIIEIGGDEHEELVGTNF